MGAKRVLETVERRGHPPKTHTHTHKNKTWSKFREPGKKTVRHRKRRIACPGPEGSKTVAES
eukprot:3767556-Pyramimonas_sp.AAC.1